MVHEDTQNVSAKHPPGVPLLAFNPLLVVAWLLAVAWLARVPAISEAVGVGNDGSLLAALVHAEFAACALLLLPGLSTGRVEVAQKLLGVLACFAAASGVLLLFHYLGRDDFAVSTRIGALAAWLFAGGALACGGRFGPAWLTRARVGLLLLYALPALAHYLALEYASAGLVSWRAWSPSWALAAGELSPWPLLPAAVVLWAVALAIPARPAPKEAA